MLNKYIKTNPQSDFGKMSKAIEEGKVDFNKYLPQSKYSKPILFSSEMVRAILDGRKTMTRRTRGLDRINADPDSWSIKDIQGKGIWFKHKRYKCHFVKYPYWVWSRLWVRETWAIHRCGSRVKAIESGTMKDRLRYPATDEAPFANYWWNKRPSIFMPKWASRITLEITNIRIERLHDLTREDAIQEGCPKTLMGKDVPETWFCALWNELKDKSGLGWNKNPWVWVISFRKIKP